MTHRLPRPIDAGRECRSASRAAPAAREASDPRGPLRQDDRLRSQRDGNWIFGDSLGDPTADDIWALAKDRPDGVTRTEVRDLFSRNKKAREIDRALTVLEEAGRLHRTMLSDGRGRPAETWLPATTARAA